MPRIDDLLKRLFPARSPGPRLVEAIPGPGFLVVRISAARGVDVRLRLSPEGASDPFYARIPGFDVVTEGEPRPGLEAPTDGCIREVLGRIEKAGFAPTAADWAETLGRGMDGRFLFGDVAEIKITKACDQKCVFCKSPPNIANLVSVDEAVGVIPRLAGRARVLSVSGGEPTLSDRLAEVVRAARAAGFGEVEIQSNGMSLADPGMVAGLKDAGATAALVSLHASDAATSDALTRVAGGFERTLAGIDNCLDAGIDVSLCHVICRGNVAGLSGFGPFVRRRFGGRRLHVVFTLSLPNYRVRSNPGLMPSLAEVRPGLLSALGSFLPARSAAPAGRDHVASVMHGSGLPLCVMGDLVRYHEEFWASSCCDPTPERVFPGRCAPCAFRPRCSGLWKLYLEMYGDAGIDPVPAGAPPA